MNIVITGASRGIGYQTALILAGAGHVVIAVSRSKEGLEKLKDASQGAPGKIIPLVFDLESGDMKILSATINKNIGSIDVLLNNAGAIINKPFETISDAELLQVYKVNVLSVFSITRELLPLMKAGSHVVNISSMGGYQGSSKFAGLSAYSSSKGALTVLSECLAEELKPMNISVNCLCLGAVQTEMLSLAFPGFKAPIEAAKMAAFIADFAITGQRYFNGKILPVSLGTI